MPISREFDHLCIVLVSTRNPLNIGAAARAMCNFGFQKLRVVNPYDTAFREARSAVGASTLLESAEEFKTIAEAIDDCTLVIGTVAPGHRRLQHSLKNLADGAPLILKELHNAKKEKRRVAILFGSEKFGLSNEHLSHCHWLVNIPTKEEQPSMNLGQAVAVCLYELVRGRAETYPEENHVLATAGDMERTTTVMLNALYASGYMDTRPSDDKEETVRRLIRRLHLSAEDTPVWLGMLRQILWKLKSKD